jgi:hypothetical protein
MGLTGTNKLCQQCIEECKQYSEVKIIRCPFFISTQKKDAIVESGYTLPLSKTPKTVSTVLQST